VGAVGDPRVKCGHDIGMAQRGGRFDLALEAQHGGRVFHRFSRQNLQGHEPFHPAVPCFEDPPHPAGAELVQNDVFAVDQGLVRPLADDRYLVFCEFPRLNQPPYQIGDVRIRKGSR